MRGRRATLARSAIAVSVLRPGQTKQSLNTIGGRRMCAEKGKHARNRWRLDDEHVRRSWVGIERNDLRRGVDLLERADEAERVAGQPRPGGIGVELSRARARRLNQHR